MTGFYDVHVSLSRKAGGRLLFFVVRADTLNEAKTKAYEELAKLHVEPAHISTIRIFPTPAGDT